MLLALASPTFAIRDIPFSYRGSWLNLSPVVGKQACAEDLHLISHQTGHHPILKLVATDGSGRVDATMTATPAKLTWTHGSGYVEAAFETPDTVRLRGRGLGLRLQAAADALTSFTGVYLYQDPVDAALVFSSYETGRRYRLTILSGQPSVEGTQALAVAERAVVLPSSDAWEIAVEEFDSARAPYRHSRDFDAVVTAAAAAFRAFADAIAPWRGPDSPAAELAAYVLWSATVGPGGFLRRPAVLMSKHWMDKVWSWDHCFNAIALAAGEADTAWDQFHIPFDHQDPTGALPDSVTHSEVLYNFVKPPVHGWALRRLREHLPDGLSREQLADVYHRLSKWTGFWLDVRRVPGQRLAHYQHGNDSGWDNATTFDRERVLQTSDLAAFLTIQARVLADLATELGDTAAAVTWRRTAEQMREAMLGELWNGAAFTARSVASGTVWTTSSLLDLMPIVLGEDLPAVIATALAERIRSHLTRFGLATELPQSPEYRPDGYWRGPIWAPATVLIEDGLRRAGFIALADEVSARFRQLCETSGFAENFDAISGEGLRDRAYTWTASAYLILAAAHTLRKEAARPAGIAA